jgi:DNA recombination protein RmuC
MDAIALVIALVTLVAGFAAGWALARGRTAGAEAGLRSERDSARAESVAVREQIREIKVERDALVERLRGAETAAAEAGARLESERASSAEKLALLDDAKAQLKTVLQLTAQDALDKNSERFMAIADTKFRAPLAETLGKVETQLREIEKNRADAQAALRTQIERVSRTGDELRQQTEALVSALRKPQARGQWGELHLRRAVELAGMADRCDFTEQTTVMTADGSMRPDLVVRLAGGKNIVVDSKVTLAAYLEAHDATDDNVRDERLTAHARHLRNHVDQLAAKSYWSTLSPAPEFVVLFVPGEAFLAPALDRDPSLLEYAFAKRVHIATPTTLISVLRSCAYAWQQEALADNAREVFDLGRELYKRLGTLGDHVDKLGRSLTSTVKAYNGTVGSLERQVLVTARKLNDLEVVDTRLDAPKPVEESIRPLGAAELVTAAEDARAVVVLPGADPVLELDRAADYGLVSDEPVKRPGSATG